MTGKYSFRFRFRIPENFRPSFFFAYAQDKFRLAHFLRGDLTGIHGQVDLTRSNQIFLNKNSLVAMPNYPSLTMAKNVYSGIFGQRKKPTSFQIVLDKSTYALGEKIKISIDCDNSASSKEVKKIKFELYLGYRA